jgi:hypothetical protein
MAIFFVDDTSFRLIYQNSALSIPHPKLSALMGSKWFASPSGNVRFMLRPPNLLAPCLGRGVYFRAFTREVTLPLVSNIAIGVNDQFPEQDFHLQDTQHYGLRADERRFSELNLGEWLNG